jgi:hypothetical protein
MILHSLNVFAVLISLALIVRMIDGPSTTFATQQLMCLVWVGTKPGILI